MTLLSIPTFADDAWTQTTTVEGVEFTLDFLLNQRAAAYYMSIADADGVDIYNGVKLTCGVPLLRKCADIRRPAGDFFVFSSTTDLSPASRADLGPGGRCTLYYISSDWIAAIKAGQADTLLAQLTANTQGIPTSSYGQK
jgi:hypothetical protein